MRNKVLLISIMSFLLFLSATLHAQSIEDKVNNYLRAAQELYRLDEEATIKIWEAYCRNYDLTQNPDKQRATSVANNWQQREQDKFRPLINDGDNLIRELETLRNDPEKKDKAEKWLDQIKKERSAIQKLENGVVLKGANHPFVQYATEYGKKMHEYLCGGYSSPKVCDKDYGSGDRPDLVYVDPSNGLYVIEFKPESSEAKSMGENQLDRYVPLVKNFYEKCFASGRNSEPKCSDSDKCPSGFLEKLKMCDAAWESDGKTLKIRREVKQYGSCDKKFN